MSSSSGTSSAELSPKGEDESMADFIDESEAEGRRANNEDVPESISEAESDGIDSSAILDSRTRRGQADKRGAGIAAAIAENKSKVKGTPPNPQRRLKKNASGSSAGNLEDDEDSLEIEDDDDDRSKLRRVEVGTASPSSSMPPPPSVAPPAVDKRPAVPSSPRTRPPAPKTVAKRKAPRKSASASRGEDSDEDSDAECDDDDEDEDDEVLVSSEEEEEHAGDDNAENMAIKVMSTKPDMESPAFFSRKLYSHQVLGLKKISDVYIGGSLLFYEPGMGKTSMALAYLCNRWARQELSNGSAAPSLVLGPKSVVSHWRREWSKFVHKDSHLRATFFADRPTEEESVKILNGHYHLVVTSYTQLRQEFTRVVNAAELRTVVQNTAFSSKRTMQSAKSSLDRWRVLNERRSAASAPAAVVDSPTAPQSKAKLGSMGSSLPPLPYDMHVDGDGMDGYLRDKRPVNVRSWAYGLKYDTVVFDEGHFARNARRKTFLSAFLIDATKRLFLSGTPVHNSVNDLYAAMRLVRARGTPSVDRWEHMHRTKKPDVLADAAKPCAFWLKKTDLKDRQMPPMLIFHRGVPLRTAAERDIYEYFASKAGELAKQAGGHSAMLSSAKPANASCPAGVLEAITMCRQASTAASLLSEKVLKDMPDHLRADGFGDDQTWFGVKSSKLAALGDYIKKHFDPAEKFVIFSEHLQALTLASMVLSELGIGFRKIIGSMSSAERDASTEAFRTQPKVRCMLMTFGAGGVGLSFEWASRCILFDPWWNPKVLEQAMSRVHRLNSKKEVRITIFYASGTIEKVILDIAEKKRKISEIFYKATSIRELLKAPAIANGTAKRAPNAPYKMDIMMAQAQSLWDSSKNKELDEEQEFKDKEERKLRGEDVQFVPKRQRSESDQEAEHSKKAAREEVEARDTSAPPVPLTALAPASRGSPPPPIATKPLGELVSQLRGFTQPPASVPKPPSPKTPSEQPAQLQDKDRKVSRSFDAVISKQKQDSAVATTAPTPAQKPAAARPTSASLELCTLKPTNIYTRVAALPTVGPASQRPDQGMNLSDVFVVVYSAAAVLLSDERLCGLSRTLSAAAKSFNLNNIREAAKCILMRDEGGFKRDVTEYETMVREMELHGGMDKKMHDAVHTRLVSVFSSNDVADIIENLSAKGRQQCAERRDGLKRQIDSAIEAMVKSVWPFIGDGTEALQWARRNVTSRFWIAVVRDGASPPQTSKAGALEMPAWSAFEAFFPLLISQGQPARFMGALGSCSGASGVSTSRAQPSCFVSTRDEGVLQAGEFACSTYEAPKIAALLEFFRQEATCGSGISCFTVGFVDTDTNECIGAIGVRLLKSLIDGRKYLRVSGVAGCVARVPFGALVKGLTKCLTHLLPAPSQRGILMIPDVYICPDSIERPLHEAIAKACNVGTSLTSHPSFTGTAEVFVALQYDHLGTEVINDRDEELTQDSLDVLTRNWTNGGGWVRRFKSKECKTRHL